MPEMNTDLLDPMPWGWTIGAALGGIGVVVLLNKLVFDDHKVHKSMLFPLLAGGLVTTAVTVDGLAGDVISKDVQAMKRYMAGQPTPTRL